MCIAIYSVKGCELPSRETLQRCFRANPDGCGFSYSYHNTVYTYKGFFRFSAFYDKLMECDEKYHLKEQGVLIHCRVATHGLINAANCHPFALTANEQKLQATKTKSKYAVIHNGICSCTARSNSKESLSDTALFVLKYLTKIATYDGWFTHPNTMPLIEQLIESKMAILSNNGDIIATSGFHQAEDGNYYSNYSYEDTYLGYYGYMLDDWYGDYGADDDICEMPLMELKRGEAIHYEDGTLEDYSAEYHGYFRTFVTDTNEVYTLYESGGYSDHIPFEYLSYVGVGEIVDSFSAVTEEGCRVIPFRADATAVL